MPYKLTRNGIELQKGMNSDSYRLRMSSNIMTDNAFRMMKGLTDLQKKALEYLYEHKDENRYIDAHEVATFYGYKNGMWFRGVLASLEKKGLLTKKEE